MAEAHSAVAFSFSITHEGWDVNFDREVLHLVWQSGVRSWKKRLARFKNNVKTGVYPAPLQSLWALVAVLAALHFSKIDTISYLIKRILIYLPNDYLPWQLVACTILAIPIWLSVIYFIRYSLKLLFLYKGWLYEERGKGRTISWQTKIWVLLIKIFSGTGQPMLYSFQGSLPRLPLPKLHDTMKRYLISVRPLVDDVKYKRMEALANEFEHGIGVKLHRYLTLKSWWSSNWVADWWEEYVYLRGRSPLMINSNFYGIDTVLVDCKATQAAKAANCIYHLLQFRRLIERQELEPCMVQGLVPLCSWQYERTFNTTRIPGIETDKIQHYNDSNHIVVIHRGRYFRVIIYHRGRILRPCEIEIQMKYILDERSLPAPGEEYLGSFTADNRVDWAQNRTKYFIKGTNRQSLDVIEKASFVVVLDDIPYEFEPEHPHKLDAFGRALFHGRGYDRWFDKSINLCIGTNGRVGFNAEHSWADAPIVAHCWEHVVVSEVEEIRYENGNTVGKPEFQPPTPTRLQWDFNAECLDKLDNTVESVTRLIEDLDLRILYYTEYGKGFMKQQSISPDAYIQMILQLAYYRTAGRFDLSYEASMTRLYREGRTETVRPCTVESSAWVLSMEDPSSKIEDKVKLLYNACQRHQLAYQDAMCGKGIDRHLFCLYVISKYLEVDSPFLKEVLSEPWKLSTSQTPHGQTNKLNLKKHPNCISAGGGFGPVADDGYGVSYIIAGEDIIFFHITSKKSCPATDTSRFKLNIEKALLDVRNLLTAHKNKNNKKSK